VNGSQKPINIMTTPLLKKHKNRRSISNIYRLHVKQETKYKLCNDTEVVHMGTNGPEGEIKTNRRWECYKVLVGRIGVTVVSRSKRRDCRRAWCDEDSRDG